MSTHKELRFGQESLRNDGRLYIVTPDEVVADVMKLPVDSRFPSLQELTKDPAVVVAKKSPGDPPEATRLMFDLPRVGRLRSEQKRQHALLGTAVLINNLQTFSRDPLISVEIGTERTSLGRYSIGGEVIWPDTRHTDDDLMNIATISMRTVASHLKYDTARMILELVYAHVRRDDEPMVSLIMNDVGGCEVDTYGGYTKPDDHLFKVSAGNIYNHTMQFIALSGMVAIAHADDIAQQ